MAFAMQLCCFLELLEHTYASMPPGQVAKKIL